MKHPGEMVAGLVFTLIGLAYVLQEFDVWTVSSRYLWPVLIIAIGISVLISGPKRTTTT
ncbi:MAG: DUF5668 domain-containing protein [Acidimicrobiia bacterium]|nr:DUF5668 domain-containing protein [Acidimicrobiia bacterium]